MDRRAAAGLPRIMRLGFRLHEEIARYQAIRRRRLRVNGPKAGAERQRSQADREER